MPPWSVATANIEAAQVAVQMELKLADTISGCPSLTHLDIIRNVDQQMLAPYHCHCLVPPTIICMLHLSKRKLLQDGESRLNHSDCQAAMRIPTVIQDILPMLSGNSLHVKDSC